MIKKKLKKKNGNNNGVLNKNLKKRVNDIHKVSFNWYEEHSGELDVEAGDIFDDMINILNELTNKLDEIYAENLIHINEAEAGEVYKKKNSELVLKNDNLKSELKHYDKALNENTMLGQQTEIYLDIIEYALTELPEHARDKIFQELNKIKQELNKIKKGSNHFIYNTSTATSPTISDGYISYSTNLDDWNDWSKEYEADE